MARPRVALWRGRGARRPGGERAAGHLAAGAVDVHFDGHAGRFRLEVQHLRAALATLQLREFVRERAVGR